MRGDERHGYHWVQDEPPGGGLKDQNDDPLADPSWGLDAGMALVALAEATNLWPLAYDWERSTDDHRLHVRRLSIFLAHRSTRAHPKRSGISANFSPEYVAVLIGR